MTFPVMTRCVACGSLAAWVATHAAVAVAAGPATRAADLPIVKTMPDPLVMRDGTRVTTADQWQSRRREMKEILEDYEYGHMPPPPGNVTGRQTDAKTLPDAKTRYRRLRLSFGADAKLGFDMAIFSPLAAPTTAPSSTQPAASASPSAVGPTTVPFTPTAALPTIIMLSFNVDERAARQFRAALDRGYAVAVLNYQQLGADNKNFRQTAFFPAYPDYDWNDFAAWAWGLSRAVDFLQTDAATDGSRLIVSGVSRLGQAALLAGAMDERIAMVAPVAGGMALRFSGKGRGGGQGVDEVVDQNTFWFGPRFAEFKGQTDRLPCDQHWLLALAAPRPFILCNSLKDQYGDPNAASQTYLAAKPVYAFLGVPDRLGLNLREGGHGMTGDDWSAILDFADHHLRGREANRRFDTLPAGIVAP